MPRGVITRTRDVHLPDDGTPPFDDPLHVEVRVSWRPHDQPRIITTIRTDEVMHHSQLLSHETAAPALAALVSRLRVNTDDQMVRYVTDSATCLRSFPARRGTHGGLSVPGVILAIEVDETELNSRGISNGGLSVPGDVILMIDVDETELDSHAVRPVSATEASIKSLEKVIYDDGCLGGSVDRCTICLEEFCCGSKVTRMPCSHVFHGGCIVPWLKKSNMCPLCRYKMPTG